MTNLRRSSEPCWLSKSQLQEAKVLIAIGFTYIGDVSNFFDEEELRLYNCGSYKSWKFNTEYMQFILNGVCNGALYSWDLEFHPDLMKPNFLNERVSEIKSALKAAESNQVGEPSPYQQLSLF